jgi:hypothetical protein
VRVILPTITPCFECYFDQIPREVNVPMCTIANTPRTPAHCVEWGILKFAEKNGFFFFFFFISNITTKIKKQMVTILKMYKQYMKLQKNVRNFLELKAWIFPSRWV